MPTSDNTVAQKPFVFSSWPTVGLTISVPTTLKPPTLLFVSASTTACFVLLSAVPDSARTVGTRTMICR